MKSFISIVAIYFLLLIASASFAQEASKDKVIITGVRFAYPLVEKWIQEYKAINPEANVYIEARTSTDPSAYDLLIEAYEPDKVVKETREFIYLGRYALLPVANAQSALAKTYQDKGLTTELFKQIYFNDIYADKKDAKKIEGNYTVYTRSQKAGAPITFAHYFGFEQANIKGKAIAGADEHLIKALLKDSVGVSYSVPGLLYDLKTRKQRDGLVVLSVDTDGNNRLNADEKFYSNLDEVILKLESGSFKNIPTEYLHLSISKNNPNPEALKFLQWVLENGQTHLHDYGFLNPEAKRVQEQKEQFKQLVLN
jgi:phosphate transport system substrate-binding protein